MLEFYFVSWGPKDLTARKHKNLTLPAKFVCCQFIRQTSRITIVLWFFCGHCQNKESLLFKVLAIVKRRTAEEDSEKICFSCSILHFALGIDRNTYEKILKRNVQGYIYSTTCNIRDYGTLSNRCGAPSVFDGICLRGH